MLRNFSFQWILGMALILGVLFVTSTWSSAQTPKEMDWSRMERDLDIMEGVLNKLLNTSAYGRGSKSGKARGLYFEGYGVVFLSDHSGFQRFALSGDRIARMVGKATEKATEVQLRLRGVAPPVVSESKDEAEEEEEETALVERVETLKGQLAEFLGTYADAIGQLEPTDRVTVLVNLADGEPFFPPSLPEQFHSFIEGELLSLLEARAKKSDIIEYRRGRISGDDFRQRVVFHERPLGAPAKMNVDIMANIMDTALSKKYHREFGSQGKTRGIYLEGLGALFFMKGDHRKAFPSNYGEAILGFQQAIEGYPNLKEQGVAPTRKEQKQRSKAKARELLEEFKDALLEVVGDYGHTLRTLKPTESAVVSVDFPRSRNFRESGPTHFMMKVQKKDLDLYNRGDLDLAAFRQRVEFLEF